MSCIEMQQIADTEHIAYTIPALARRSGISPRRLRLAVKAGTLRGYTADTAWVRIFWRDFEAWLESTRFVPGPTVEDRVEQRVDEQIRRESSLGGG